MTIVASSPGQTSSDDTVAMLAKSQAKTMSIAFQNAANKMLPCVVTVLAKRSDVNETLDELDLLDSKHSRDYNFGSGVILSEDGLCVTNYHVVKGAKGIRVRMGDGRELLGTDVRSDPSSDLATFKIKSDTPLRAATIGDSDVLIVGDWVIAIGSPFSLDQTVSVGIISSKGRSLPDIGDGQLLQTDATINPGNSGGALLDLNGELVGINTAIASANGIFQGVGFAIPSKRMKWIVSELETYSKVRRAKLGMKVDRLPQSLAAELKLPVRGGVYVTKVNPDSPALATGLNVGDVVVELANQRVFTPDDFRRIVEQLPGDHAYPIKVIRDGKTETFEIKPEIPPIIDE
jgi:serine protease Do